MSIAEQLLSQWDTLLSLTHERWEYYASLKETIPKCEGGVKAEEAERLFRQVVSATEKVIGLRQQMPRLIFYPAISEKKRKFRNLSIGLGMVLSAMSVVVVCMVKAGAISITEGYYCVLPIVLFLPLPWTMYKRIGEYMDQGSYYLGAGEIVIYDLPRARFLSYCAHEVASHLLSKVGPSWEFYKGGWTRGVQWQVASVLAKEGECGAAIPTLRLMLGEMRMALEWLSKREERALPRWIRRLPSPFASSWWREMIAGKRRPTSDTLSQAFSTIYFQLLEKREGPGVYKEYLEGKADTRWPFVPSDPKEW